MESGMPPSDVPSPLGRYLGAVLREVRRSRGWCLAELQRRSKVDRRTICRIEEGTADPRADTIDRLCCALGAPVGAVMEEADRRRREQG